MTDQLTAHLYLWGVPTRHAGRALLLMATQRSALRALPEVTFAKLLGTGSGRTFTVRDADINHWGAMVVTRSAGASAEALAASGPIRRWEAIAEETLVVRMRPLASRGQWAGREPFGSPHPHRWDGPVAAVTRGRIRARQLARFLSAVPPVAADLAGRPGLVLSVGIGEAPIGLQGTFSIWDSNQAITEFAQRGDAHRRVMQQTKDTGWYAEELFARLAVLEAHGTFDRNPIALGPAGPASSSAASSASSPAPGSAPGSGSTAAGDAR